MTDSKVLTASGNRRPPAAGKGRIKGTPNKNTAELKGMILGALSDVGGRKYLATQADKNPTAFMALIGRILPKDINADINAKITLEDLVKNL